MYILGKLRPLIIRNDIREVVYRLSSKLPVTQRPKDVKSSPGDTASKKTAEKPKITLLSGQSLSVTTLEEAEKVSARRNLMLVKITDVDAKTQRPVYQLMTGSEYHAENLKQKKERKNEKQSSKGEKISFINCKIGQHDLDTQIRKAVKWIEKMYEVKVVINGASGGLDLSEKVFSRFEDHFKKEVTNAKFTKKVTKGSDISFSILPTCKNNNL